MRLGDAAGAYLSTGTDPAGRTLARAVRAGELLPRTALEEPQELVQVALPVQAGYVPPGLARGQVVDVYGVTDPAGTTTGEGVVLVVGAAPVQAVSGRTDGVLSTATTTVQVVVSVPAAQAPGVLGSIGGRPLVVVAHSSVDDPPAAAASGAPAAAPTPARPSAGGTSPSAPPAAPSAPAAPSGGAVPSAGSGVPPVPGTPAGPTV